MFNQLGMLCPAGYITSSKIYLLVQILLNYTEFAVKSQTEFICLLQSYVIDRILMLALNSLI